MDARSIVTDLAKMVSSASVGLVVGNVVKHTLPVKMNGSDKILTGIGTWLITGIAAREATKYIEEYVSDFFPKKEQKNDTESETPVDAVPPAIS